MQFSTVALFAAAASAASVVTETDVASTLVTITSCGSEVTDCPNKHHNNDTAPTVSSYEAGAAKQYAAGAVALAAGALLAL